MMRKDCEDCKLSLFCWDSSMACTASILFLIQIFPQLGLVEKEYIKLGVGKIVSRAHLDIVVATQALLLRL